MVLSINVLNYLVFPYIAAISRYSPYYLGYVIVGPQRNSLLLIDKINYVFFFRLTTPYLIQINIMMQNTTLCPLGLLQGPIPRRQYFLLAL